MKTQGSDTYDYCNNIEWKIVITVIEVSEPCETPVL